MRTPSTRIAAGTAALAIAPLPAYGGGNSPHAFDSQRKHRSA